MSFDMRTSVYTGLIAYIQEGETFLILELINSSIHYIARSTQEADSTDFVEIYPTVNVSDGKWHSVTLKSYIHVCIFIFSHLCCCCLHNILVRICVSYD